MISRDTRLPYGKKIFFCERGLKKYRIIGIDGYDTSSIDESPYWDELHTNFIIPAGYCYSVISTTAKLSVPEDQQDPGLQWRLYRGRYAPCFVILWSAEHSLGVRHLRLHEDYLASLLGWRTGTGIQNFLRGIHFQSHQDPVQPTHHLFLTYLQSTPRLSMPVKSCFY